MGKLAALDHLKACAEAAKKFTGDRVSELAQTALNALKEMNEAKADKGSSEEVTIPASGWASDSSASYPNYYDIAAEGVTAKDRADVAILPESVEAAVVCGLCPTTETLEGKIRLRAASVPSSSIAAQYWVGKGA